MAVVVRNVFSPSTDRPTVNSSPSLTKQAPKNDADINEIMRKYADTSVITNIAKGTAKFGDFSKVPDYQGALNMIEASRELFMGLPSTLRKRFDNNPGQLISFLGNPANVAEAISLGLVNPPSQVSPPSPAPVSPAPSGASQPAPPVTT